MSAVAVIVYHEGGKEAISYCKKHIKTETKLFIVEIMKEGLNVQQGGKRFSENMIVSVSILTRISLLKNFHFHGNNNSAVLTDVPISFSILYLCALLKVSIINTEGYYSVSLV